MSDLQISLFLINLDDDDARLKTFEEALTDQSLFKVIRVPAVPGRYLPDAACAELSGSSNWARKKGEIGCFLSHVKVWELIAASDIEFGVVLEDDVLPRALHRLAEIVPPTSFDLVFINDRTSPGTRNDPLDEHLECLQISEALAVLNRSGKGPGSDGYVITRAGAQKLLSVTSQDLYFGNIDWRLIRYSVTADLLENELAGTRVDVIIRNHHNPSRPPAWGVLRAACLNTPLVVYLTFPSRIVGPHA